MPRSPQNFPKHLPLILAAHAFLARTPQTQGCRDAAPDEIARASAQIRSDTMVKDGFAPDPKG